MRKMHRNWPIPKKEDYIIEPKHKKNKQKEKLFEAKLKPTITFRM